MRASPDLRDVLYVAGEYVPSGDHDRSMLGETLRVSEVTIDALASDGVPVDPDCILLGALGRERQYLAAVERIQTVYPQTPLVVFSGDQGPALVEDLLAAGANDVIRSALAHAPETLVTRRIENVLGTVRRVHDVGHGVSDEGDLTRIVGIARDITERKHHEQELQAERDVVAQIFEASPVGIVVFDTDGQVVRANEEAAMMAVDPAASEGTVRADGTRASDGTASQPESRSGDGSRHHGLAPTELPVERILETETAVRDEELVLDRPDGETTVVSVNGVPLYEDGSVARVVLTVEDVTEHEERARRLEEHRNELAQLDRLNQTIRDVDAALIGASDRATIEQAVCDRLTGSGRYRYTVALRATAGRLHVATGCEEGESFAADVFPLRAASREACPACTALDTGNAQAVPDVRTAELFPDGPWRETLAAAGVRSMAAFPVTYEDRPYGVFTVYATETDAFSDRELDILGELGSNVGHAIAAVESRQREATLTSLYEATQDLLAADSRQAVCDVVVGTASSVLDPEGVGIFLFDEASNSLEPAAATETLLSFYDGSTVFGPTHGDSVTWQTYVTGETAAYDDIRDADALANPDTEARGALLVPLGDHGVFVVAQTERGALAAQRRRLVGLLATTTEAALDRVTDRADIRERDRELATRDARLSQFEAVFDLLDGVERAVRQASTRAEVDQAICEQAVRMDGHTFAWVGRVPPDGTNLEPQAWAGAEQDYLDSISRDTGGDGGADPAVRAAKGETAIVQNVPDHLRDADWARAALDRGYLSAMALPLEYGETTYGVLAIYADTSDQFDDVVRRVVEALGTSIAHSISVVETERAVLAERTIELELRLPETATFLNRVARVAGEPVTYREILPERDGRASVLFTLSDPPVAEVLGLEDDSVTVESLTHAPQDDDHRFRAVLSGETVPTTLVTCGSVPQDVTSSETETTATVRLPQELDVRVFLDRLRERYETVELVSRREARHGGVDKKAVETVLTEDLTDRQRDVLMTAYESGYFESPRKMTGSELADLLDVSQPTITHHLRAAQRRLFAAILES